MTNSTLLLDKAAPSDKTACRHESRIWLEAAAFPGVRYRIARVSVARRIELARRIREIGRKVEFLEASGDAREKLEAAVLAGEIERDRKSTRLNSSHIQKSRMPSSA